MKIERFERVDIVKNALEGKLKESDIITVCPSRFPEIITKIEDYQTYGYVSTTSKAGIPGKTINFFAGTTYTSRPPYFFGDFVVREGEEKYQELQKMWDEKVTKVLEENLEIRLR